MSIDGYKNYIENKKVILIGPASYLVGKKLGKYIDSFDVIVRINNAFPVDEELQVDYGCRADVIYHNLRKTMSPSRKEIEKWKELGVQWIMGKGAGTDNRHKIFQPKTKGLMPLIPVKKTQDKVRKNIKKAPNMGLIAIEHLLEMPIKSLYVLGFDFYETGYYPGYNNMKKKDALKAKNVTGAHDNTTQIKYLSKLVESEPRLIIDENLEKILNQEKIRQQKIKEESQQKLKNIRKSKRDRI